MGFVVREMQGGVRQVLCEEDLRDIGMCFSKCYESVFLKIGTAWFEIELKGESRGRGRLNILS